MSINWIIVLQSFLKMEIMMRISFNILPRGLRGNRKRRKSRRKGRKGRKVMAIRLDIENIKKRKATNIKQKLLLQYTRLAATYPNEFEWPDNVQNKL